MLTSLSETLPDPSQWVELFGDGLYRFAFSRLKDESLAEDLVQETFLTALQKQNSFQDKARFSTWLTGILRNKIADHFRKTQKQGFSIQLEEFFDQENDNEGNYFRESGKTGHWKVESGPQEWGDTLKDEQLIQFMEICLSLLPDRWASIFQEKHLYGKKSEQICKEAGLSSSNYWVILHRARLTLRECIEGKWKTAK